MARFRPNNKAKVVFAPAVANLAAPTTAEINAGTVLCTPGTYAADGLFDQEVDQTLRDGGRADHLVAQLVDSDLLIHAVEIQWIIVGWCIHGARG